MIKKNKKSTYLIKCNLATCPRNAQSWSFEAILVGANEIFNYDYYI